MQDLLFEPNSFSYPVMKTRAFRNYLNIYIPEIVNMPGLGFEVTLWKNITYYRQGQRVPDPRTDLIINAIIGGVSEYNIVVKSYTEIFNSNGTITFNDIVLG